jgi:hypothetical protein
MWIRKGEYRAGSTTADMENLYRHEMLSFKLNLQELFSRQEWIHQ